MKVILVTPSIGNGSSGPGKITNFLIQFFIKCQYISNIFVICFDINKKENTIYDQKVLIYQAPINKLQRIIFITYILYKYSGKNSILFSLGDWLWTSLAHIVPFKKKIFRLTGDPIWEKYLNSFSNGIPENYSEFYEKKDIFLFCISWLRRLFVKRYSIFVSGSISSIKTLNQWGICQSKISVIRNPVSNIKFIDHTSRSYNIYSASRIIGLKKIDLIGRLSEQINISVDVYGDGPLLDELRSKYKKLNFYGYVNENLLSSVITNYKFFISMSCSEQSPNSVINAMASGCIPILSDIESHRELIGSIDESLLISLSCTEQVMASRIEEILNFNDQKLTRIQSRCFDYVKSNHSVKIFEHKIERLLN